MRRVILFLFFTVSFTGVLPLSAQDGDDVPRFEQKRCAGNLPTNVNVICGVLIVPEDRSDPESDVIRLAVAILQSHSASPASDPVVSLTGGPGGVTVPFLNYSFRPNYREFLDSRDFIMFDQRGVGYSDPAVDCTDMLRDTYQNASLQITRQALAQLEVDQLIKCHDDLISSDYRMDIYNTAENAADLNDLRTALGYDEWNLFGVSYGTKLALTTMRDYPEGLRSVILDSVYPLQSNLYTEYPANQQRAFDLLFETCAADTQCSTDYPNLADQFYTLVDQLNAEPLHYQGRHSWRNFNYDVNFTGDMIVSQVFGMLYVKNEIPRIPKLIHALANEDYSELPTIIEQVLDVSNGISEGMYYSVQCGEEIYFSDKAEALASEEVLHASLRPQYETMTESIFQVCDRWQSRPAQAIENEPVSSTIPTLVFSGEFDPITPPLWGQLVADDLPNSYFYTLPTVGHGAVRSETCALNIALQFLDDPNTEPNSTCIEEIPSIQFSVP